VGNRHGCQTRIDELVEGHGDVRAELLLDGDGAFRCEPMWRAIDVAGEDHPAFVDLSQVRQAEDLEAARVGENGSIPGHELVKPAQPRDPIGAGTKAKVVGVAQDDLGARGMQVGRGQALDRCLGAHGHELRRVDDAVRRLQPAESRAGDARRTGAEAHGTRGHEAAGYPERSQVRIQWATVAPGGVACDSTTGRGCRSFPRSCADGSASTSPPWAWRRSRYTRSKRVVTTTGGGCWWQPRSA